MSNIKTIDLFNRSNIIYIDNFIFSEENPWDLLGKLNSYIDELVTTGIKGYTRYKENILIGKNVKISETSTIIGPAIIGDNVEIRPGAYIRGYVIIGDNSVIGNSSELKHSILMSNVQVPHFNYVGDSILGNHAHMGAGSILSNLRSDKANVVIHDKGIDIPTNMRKVGSFLGDYADIGCNSVLNPGTIIGKNTQVYPLTMCRGVYPPNSIVKSTTCVVDKK